MLITFCRAIILYIVVFVVIRLMGKRELSKVEPFELVIIMLAADLAATPIASKSISIFEGIIPIIALLICYLIFTMLVKTDNKIENALCGKLSVIIKDGKIIEKELRKQQYTIEELMCQLRERDVFKVQDVKFAVLETNGNINVVTNDKAFQKFPQNVIEEGKIVDNALNILGITENNVHNLLKKNKLKIENILIATIDENNNFLYQLHEGEK